MEEDIKILERTIDLAKKTGMDITLATAIENLLKRYKELEENKVLKTIKGFEEENIEVSKFGEWVGKDYIDYKFEYENYQRILANSIPISVIQNKINWHKNYEGTVLYKKYNYELIIQVLQELLDERNK